MKLSAYVVNKKICAVATRMVSLFKGRSEEERPDLAKERIEKILLVRANFRLGNSILATPAIFLFRKNFPRARIDFVGSAASEVLYEGLPIDHHYQITRRFPNASWAYLTLLKKIRSVGYDLAVDVSCSQSAMGSFIVGFSGARFGVGCQGRWDRWFNVRIPRPTERNKYRILPAFIDAMGLQTQQVLPSLVLSAAEKEKGRRRIESLVGRSRGPIVGVFVGGRKTRGKRWPTENFCQLISELGRKGIAVIVCFGPEEGKLTGLCKRFLQPKFPLVFEPRVRTFAAMVSSCDLFITSDSGPMHLACAAGTRTVAIFQSTDFDRWGPPPDRARIVYKPGGPPAEEVLKVCLAELKVDDIRWRGSPETQGEGPLNLSDHARIRYT